MNKYITMGGILMFSAVSQAAEVPVYIGSGADTGISYCLLDTDTGELKFSKLAVETPKPGALALSKDKSTIYAVGREKGEKLGFVASFAVQEDGSLERLSKQSSMGSGPCHLSLDATSRCLFVANYGGGNVASYHLSAKEDAEGKDFSGGKVSEAVSFYQHEGFSVNKKRQNAAHAHSIYASPDNRFVYAADLGTDEVVIYTLDAKTAKMTPNGSAKVPAGGGPRHMTFSADGKTLYVLNELSLTVSRFARDAESGGLTLEMTKPVMVEAREQMSCSEIRLSDDGKFLYTASRDLAEQQRDTISVLNAKDLSIIQEQAAGVWIPRHFNISPSGKWLLIAGQKADQVVVHARDPKTGMLKATEHAVEIKQPMWVLFR